MIGSLDAWAGNNEHGAVQYFCYLDGEIFHLVGQLSKPRLTFCYFVTLVCTLVLGTFSNFAAERVANSSSRLRLIGD